MLFIERLENPSPLVSLRRAESESGSHHYLRWVLLANARRDARTDERRGKKTPLHPSTRGHTTRQKALAIRHATTEAGGNPILSIEAQTPNLPHPTQVSSYRCEANSQDNSRPKRGLQRLGRGNTLTKRRGGETRVRRLYFDSGRGDINSEATL